MRACKLPAVTGNLRRPRCILRLDPPTLRGSSAKLDLPAFFARPSPPPRRCPFCGHPGRGLHRLRGDRRRLSAGPGGRSSSRQADWHLPRGHRARARARGDHRGARRSLPAGRDDGAHAGVDAGGPPPPGRRPADADQEQPSDLEDPYRRQRRRRRGRDRGSHHPGRRDDDGHGDVGRSEIPRSEAGQRGARHEGRRRQQRGDAQGPWPAARRVRGHGRSGPEGRARPCGRCRARDAAARSAQADRHRGWPVDPKVVHHARFNDAIVVANLAFELGGRRFDYKDALSPNTSSYSVFGAPMPSVGVEVYPAARTKIPIVRDLGLTMRFAHAFGLSSTTDDGTEVSTGWTRIGGGLRALPARPLRRPDDRCQRRD